jgi:hypothetical protein
LFCILKETKVAETYQSCTHIEVLQALETAVWCKYLGCVRSVTVQHSEIEKDKFKVEC